MSTRDPVEVARRIAAQAPAAMVPCPRCEASLKGQNLERHLAKTHPEAVRGSRARTAWTGLGWKRGRLSVRGGVIELRRWWFPARRVTLPNRLTVGQSYWQRPDPRLPTAVADHVPNGSYLRVGEGFASIVVRSRTGGQLRRHWLGWEQGPARNSAHVTLSAADFASLQYSLADQGMLRLRG